MSKVLNYGNSVLPIELRTTYDGWINMYGKPSNIYHVSNVHTRINYVLNKYTQFYEAHFDELSCGYCQIAKKGVSKFVTFFESEDDKTKYLMRS